MQEQLWAQLTADFSPNAIQWRVTELSEDNQQARVTAQLHPDAVTERLNSVLGLRGWSNTFIPLRNDAVGCSLSIGELTKTSMLPFLDTVASAARAQDAFVKAAEAFGLEPGVDTKQTYWVDYDSEAGAILFEPEVNSGVDSTVPNPDSAALLSSAPLSSAPLSSAPLSTPPSSAPPPSSTEAAPLVDSANADAGKSEGQKAIDRLVERLKNEGLNLEVAKLTVTYKGYGDSPDASRELYSKLRALLKDSGKDSGKDGTKNAAEDSA